MAMASQRQQLLRELLHLGCVEISEPDGKLADPGMVRFAQTGKLPPAGYQK